MRTSLIMAEGDMMMLHGRFIGLGLPANCRVDIVRIENGLLAEHWTSLRTRSRGKSQPAVVQMFGDGVSLLMICLGESA